MVKVEIVDEKEETHSVYASSSSSRTGSTDSLDSTISEPEAESFYDRIAALVDIIPPTTRYSIANRVSKTASALKRAGKLAGNVVWIVTTSALLVGLPLALSLEDEAKIVAQEKEMLAQQAGVQQVRYDIPPCSLCAACLAPPAPALRWRVVTPLCRAPIPTSSKRESSHLASDSLAWLSMPFFFIESTDEFPAAAACSLLAHAPPRPAPPMTVILCRHKNPISAQHAGPPRAASRAKSYDLAPAAMFSAVQFRSNVDVHCTGTSDITGQVRKRIRELAIAEYADNNTAFTFDTFDTLPSSSFFSTHATTTLSSDHEDYSES
ncbi:hypothetical protein EW145_g1940 [Phellinidium pouzarii]|uniref:Uncharacterized protein n=1 Tax=Phellinidium pouzarii TaxID=167371 RepID=A0A4S4LD36_9AGAM|nr:hypothetical protein EW145_g1940 [Phellinidium pouzarii]